MRPIEIEVWALRVVEKVKKGSPSEDSRIELKSMWPDPVKAARQIAGHANAARGDDLLWLIGVDEAGGVVAVSKEELADWMPRFKAEFDSVSPEILPVNVHCGEATVVALHIQTDFAPYLVRVPDFGKVKGLAAKWETPWREGNSTRTATRSELLQLLVPKVQQPQFEILQASASFDPTKNEISIQQQIYIVPPRDSFYVYPKHKAFVTLVLGEKHLGGRGLLIFYSNRQLDFASARAAALARADATPHITVRTGDEAVEVTATEIIVRAPGILICQDTLRPEGEFDLDQPLKVETWFQSAHEGVTCRLVCVMQRWEDRDGHIEWGPRHSGLKSQFTVS